MSTTPPQPEDATQLMVAAAGGDKTAADRLLPLVYEQLRKAAQLGLADERAGHTLSATALVHEAYLKLVGPREVAWASRGHFYAAAAESMRRILIDYARADGLERLEGMVLADNRGMLGLIGSLGFEIAPDPEPGVVMSRLEL